MAHFDQLDVAGVPWVTSRGSTEEPVSPLLLSSETTTHKCPDSLSPSPTGQQSEWQILLLKPLTSETCLLPHWNCLSLTDTPPPSPATDGCLGLLEPSHFPFLQNQLWRWFKGFTYIDSLLITTP